VELLRRAAGAPAHLVIFPGTFNPVTVAHLALARAALRVADEVLFALPREFPHKPYQGASFTQRVEMLRAALEEEAAFSLAATAGGLFAEIAAECRRSYGAAARFSFLCGRDAAERVVEWDYGRPGAIREMLSRFNLLVAARGGAYAAPPELRHAIQPLELGGGWDAISATEVRKRIARGEAWEHLVPAAARELAKRIYAPPGSVI
jgi:nicotinate-nucleotide adenylyltransferase